MAFSNVIMVVCLALLQKTLATWPPVSPSPSRCTNATCCKSGVTDPTFGQICDEFYGSTVAITMLSHVKWQTGFTFLPEPATQMGHHFARSISMLTSYVPQHPYRGHGTSRAGVVFTVNEHDNFWKFFTICKKDNKLCAQCADGYKCGVGAGRKVMPPNFTYETFVKQTFEVLNITTSTRGCPSPVSGKHGHNEFDTNALSSTALRGVFIPRSSHADTPAESVICMFMHKANPSRKEPWPLYVYDVFDTQASLQLVGTLNCTRDSKELVV